MLDPKLLGESIANKLLEASDNTKKVVVYAGRFQPFHPGHFATYQHLVRKFGKDSVFIGTSNKVEKPKSPLNFKEKVQIMTTMFNVPKNKIVEIKNPYAPKEILQKFPDETVFITVVGEKDASRLGGSYFEKYKDGLDYLGYAEKGYVYIAPSQAAGLSGTQVRNELGDPSLSDEIKKVNFERIYKKFNQKIFNLVTDKLTESVVLEWVILKNGNLFESITSGVGPDDGPGFMHANFKNYKGKSTRDLQHFLQTGWTIVKYMLDDSKEQKLDAPHYPNGPVDSVSYFPAGVLGATTPNNQEDIYGVQAYNKWKKHVLMLIRSLGWQFAQSKQQERFMKKLSVDGAKNLKSGINESFDRIDFYKDYFKNLAPNNFSVEKSGDKIVIEMKSLNENQVLTEGGAYGHMLHPFEDMNLKFSDLKKMIELGLSGRLDVEQGVTEKTDGQALSISWRSDRGLIAARNKSHLKDRGANALTVDGVKQMFKGRGELEKSFSFAIDDLSNAISKLSDKQKNLIFAEGKKFMALEVIYPATQNVIPYGLNLLVFHGSMEYDENGQPIGEDRASGRILAGMIKQVNQDVQSTFKIQGPPIVKIPKSKDFSKSKAKYFSQLAKLQSEFNLKDNDEVSLYHQKWWERFVFRKAVEYKYTIPTHVLQRLVQRWAFFDKSYGLRNLQKDIDDTKFSDWVVGFDKKNHLNQVKENMQPFETLFLQLGAEILENVSDLLTVNPQKAVQELRNSIESTISDLKKSKDVTKIQKLNTELKRIESLGGISKLVPTEGIVFQFKGNTYKLTGIFAPINQLLGIIKY